MQEEEKKTTTTATKKTTAKKPVAKKVKEGHFITSETNEEISGNDYDFVLLVRDACYDTSEEEDANGKTMDGKFKHIVSPDVFYKYVVNGYFRDIAMFEDARGNYKKAGQSKLSKKVILRQVLEVISEIKEEVADNSKNFPVLKEYFGSHIGDISSLDIGGKRKVYRSFAKKVTTMRLSNIIVHDFVHIPKEYKGLIK